MEIKITPKKVIIALCVLVVVFFAGLCTERFSRSGRASGTSQQLIEGIVLERDTVNQIADELNISGNLLSSGTSFGPAVIESLREARTANQLGAVCVDEIRRSIERDIEFSKDLRASADGFFGTAEYALNLAIERAELYEGIISTYEQANRDLGEVNNQSE